MLISLHEFSLNLVNPEDWWCLMNMLKNNCRRGRAVECSMAQVDVEYLPGYDHSTLYRASGAVSPQYKARV